MTEKKYAIVGCQRKCPYYEVISKKCLLDLEDCSKECINIKGKFQYGDAKEQLIRKMAQIISRYRNNLEDCEYCDMKDEFEIAKKIVEFLGVE